MIVFSPTILYEMQKAYEKENEEMRVNKKVDEICLKSLNELEAKAKAFDVLKEVLEKIYQTEMVLDNKKYCGTCIDLGDTIIPISKEVYEILKKAGIE